MLPEPCKTCYFKEISGEMMDPCFPCLTGNDFLFGKIKKYSRWVDGKFNEEQYEQYREWQIEKLKQDENIMEIINEMVEIVVKSHSEKSNG